MAYEIKVAQTALKTLNKWKKSNPNLYKKCQKIFHELLDHPKTGIGHPEQLKGEGVTCILVILPLITESSMRYLKTI